jgi:hypothetical protein
MSGAGMMMPSYGSNNRIYLSLERIKSGRTNLCKVRLFWLWAKNSAADFSAISIFIRPLLSYAAELSTS